MSDVRFRANSATTAGPDIYGPYGAVMERTDEPVGLGDEGKDVVAALNAGA